MEPARVKRELEELASNLWWTWNGDAQELWRRVAANQTGQRHERFLRNPHAALRRVVAKQFRTLAADSSYRAHHRRVLAALKCASRSVSRVEGLSWRRPVVYFSMEFGLHESLPIYSGGLGILAGDHTKSASDEGVPLIGVGLLYSKGYFRQLVDPKGKMQVQYPRLDFTSLPVELVRDKSGRELQITVELADGKVHARVWRVAVGQVSVYLLDTDFARNRPAGRQITQQLYGGSRENRLRQELVLGIGGARAIEALGIQPGVWHLNEGHVAFLGLERLRRLREQGLDPSTALEWIAGSTVFTTHTPVPAGNEVFDIALVRRYTEPFATAAGLPVDSFLELGLDDKADHPLFSMTVLALRLSRFRGGVSALHGEVAREMWSSLWPSCRQNEVPISSVTNGIHTPSWVAPQFDALFKKHVGEDWTSHLSKPDRWKRATKIPAAELWSNKQALKEKLIAFVRERETDRLARYGWSAARRQRATTNLLRPDALTIGFARRFALYKRSSLLFWDLEQAARLFTSAQRPIQIIFAGKPHPDDDESRKVCEKIARLAARREFRGKVVLLENYDAEICRHMAQGVDIWLNNPRRPLEASGTSGQKVPVNGGLNLSILDGWWCEGYTPKTGWAFGSERKYDNEQRQDEDDARALYQVLREEVIPCYYTRDRQGLPRQWIARMKQSIARHVPLFSTHRMVREYAERYYRPAFDNGRSLQARGGARARELIRWQDHVYASWPLVHMRNAESQHNGLVIEIFLGSIDPKTIQCWDDDEQMRTVRVLGQVDSGVYRLRVVGKPGRLRFFPTHPHLVHPQELGIAVEID